MGIPEDCSPVTFEKDPERKPTPAAVIGYCYGFYVKCPPSAFGLEQLTALFGML